MAQIAPALIGAAASIGSAALSASLQEDSGPNLGDITGEAADARKRALAAERLRKGRASTILTGGGIGNPLESPSVGKTTLLGG